MLPLTLLLLILSESCEVTGQGQGLTCVDQPCNNDAVCENTDSGYQCYCVSGFTGRNCSINFNDCVSSPCKNGATCTDGVDTFACNCVQGFTGQYCETDIDECTSDPCQHGGTCINLINAFSCQCPLPYRGDNCDLLPCQTDPCENEAVCVNDENLEISLTGYVCECVVGFSGTKCEININECNSYNDTACGQGGVCIDGVDDYSCLCEPGWVGKDCQFPINDCLRNECRNNATCVDEHLGYECICAPGYDGLLCEREKDECEVISPCQNGGKCVDLFDGYICECDLGWLGENCTETVAECLINLCKNGATCLQLDGDVLCRCAPYYRGPLCQNEYNPCDPVYNPCLNNATCVIPPDSQYKCFCTTGFSGQHCEINVNECLQMPCENNATCEDVTAGYVCHCLPGYTGQNCDLDIDDCDPQPCLNGGQCIDRGHRFDCNCSKDYTGRLCEELVDHCLSIPCYHDGTCTTVAGGYRCQCLSPYTGPQCLQSLNACQSQPCLNNGTCINLSPGYVCNCPTPFTGQMCHQIINHCESGPCLNDGVCQNNINGFNCVCPAFLTGKQCTELADYCTGDPCANGATCINGNGRFRCACLYGYTGERCDVMVDFCGDDPCSGSSASCTNIPGGFLCDCLTGYTGKRCETVIPSSSSVSPSLTLQSSTLMHSISTSQPISTFDQTFTQSHRQDSNFDSISRSHSISSQISSISVSEPPSILISSSPNTTSYFTSSVTLGVKASSTSSILSVSTLLSSTPSFQSSSTSASYTSSKLFSSTSTLSSSNLATHQSSASLSTRSREITATSIRIGETTLSTSIKIGETTLSTLSTATLVHASLSSVMPSVIATSEITSVLETPTNFLSISSSPLQTYSHTVSATSNKTGETTLFTLSTSATVTSDITSVLQTPSIFQSISTSPVQSSSNTISQALAPSSLNTVSSEFVNTSVILSVTPPFTVTSVLFSSSTYYITASSVTFTSPPVVSPLASFDIVSTTVQTVLRSSNIASLQSNWSSSSDNIVNTKTLTMLSISLSPTTSSFTLTSGLSSLSIQFSSVLSTISSSPLSSPSSSMSSSFTLSSSSSLSSSTSSSSSTTTTPSLSPSSFFSSSLHLVLSTPVESSLIPQGQSSSLSTSSSLTSLISSSPFSSPSSFSQVITTSVPSPPSDIFNSSLSSSQSSLSSSSDFGVNTTLLNINTVTSLEITSLEITSLDTSLPTSSSISKPSSIPKPSGTQFSVSQTSGMSSIRSLTSSTLSFVSSFETSTISKQSSVTNIVLTPTFLSSLLLISTQSSSMSLSSSSSSSLSTLSSASIALSLSASSKSRLQSISLTLLLPSTTSLSLSTTSSSSSLSSLLSSSTLLTMQTSSQRLSLSSRYSSMLSLSLISRPTFTLNSTFSVDLPTPTSTSFNILPTQTSTASIVSKETILVSHTSQTSLLTLSSASIVLSGSASSNSRLQTSLLSLFPSKSSFPSTSSSLSSPLSTLLSTLFLSSTLSMVSSSSSSSSSISTSSSPPLSFSSSSSSSSSSSYTHSVTLHTTMNSMVQSHSPSLTHVSAKETVPQLSTTELSPFPTSTTELSPFPTSTIELSPFPTSAPSSLTLQTDILTELTTTSSSIYISFRPTTFLELHSSIVLSTTPTHSVTESHSSSVLSPTNTHSVSESHSSIVLSPTNTHSVSKLHSSIVLSPTNTHSVSKLHSSIVLSTTATHSVSKLHSSIVLSTTPTHSVSKSHSSIVISPTNTHSVSQSHSSIVVSPNHTHSVSESHSSIVLSPTYIHSVSESHSNIVVSPTNTHSVSESHSSIVLSPTQTHSVSESHSSIVLSPTHTQSVSGLDVSNIVSTVTQSSQQLFSKSSNPISSSSERLQSISTSEAGSQGHSSEVEVTQFKSSRSDSLPSLGTPEFTNEITTQLSPSLTSSVFTSEMLHSVSKPVSMTTESKSATSTSVLHQISSSTIMKISTEPPLTIKTVSITPTKTISISMATVISSTTTTLPTSPCDSFPCYHGGQCVDVGTTVSCNCTERYTGQHCEIVQDQSLYIFRGDKYIVTAPRFIGDILKISLSFKTYAESGLLVYAETEAMLTDSGNTFIQLSLHNGFLVYEFHCVVQTFELDTKVKVNTGTYITIHIRQERSCQATLTLAQAGDLSEPRSWNVGSNQLIERYHMTDFSSVLIGGVISITDLDMEANFTGCLGNISMNGVPFLPKDALNNIALEPCANTTLEVILCENVVCYHGAFCSITIATSGKQETLCNCPLHFTGSTCHQEILLFYPSFDGHAYLEHAPPSFTGSHSNEIFISLTPDQDSGTVLYSESSANQNGGNKAFVYLYLSNGRVFYRFSCDGQIVSDVDDSYAFTIREELKITIRQTWPLRPGLWCSAAIEVNGQTFISSPVLTQSPALPLGYVYIGGTRGSAVDTRGSADTQGMVGCVKHYQVNSQEIDLIAMATGGVNVVNCDGDACSHKPCKNGATCHSSGDEWFCECLPGYGGALCERQLCHDDPCQHGGTCIVMETENDQLCLCPYGRGGVLCEMAVNIDIPHFSGTHFGYPSFLAYQPTTNMKSAFEIKFSFILDNQTAADNSLILFIGNTGPGSDVSDYMGVGLYLQYLVFFFNLGSGEVQIWSDKAIDPSLPQHVVHCGRHYGNGWLQVDQGRNITGTSPGILTDLNLGFPSWLYVGGADFSDNDQQPFSVNFQNNFQGCVLDLQVDAGSMGKFSEPGMPPGHPEFGRSVQQCSAWSCDPNPCQNEAECVTVGASFYCNCSDDWTGLLCKDTLTVCDRNHSCVGGATCLPTTPEGYRCMCPLGRIGTFCEEELTISDARFMGEDSYMSFLGGNLQYTAEVSMTIKAESLDGLLFYVSERLHKNSGDFLSLSLTGGNPELRYHLGSELVVLRSDVNISNDLGTWLVIKGGRNSSHSYVAVNDNVTITLTTLHMTSLDVSSVFYIGGLPRLELMNPAAMLNDPTLFTGCVSELVVNGRQYLLTREEALSGRNIEDCDGTLCGHSVCRNNGTCLVVSDVEYNCSCTEMYYGKNCEISVACRDHGCQNEGLCQPRSNDLVSSNVNDDLVSSNVNDDLVSSNVNDDDISSNVTTPYKCNCFIGFHGDVCQNALNFTAARLSGDGFLFYKDTEYETSNRSQTQISFSFKTAQTDGLVFWNGQASTADEDYLGVGLSDGRVQLVWNLGWKSKDEIISTDRYNNDQWHVVNITRKGRSLTLRVDEEEHKSLVPGDFTNLDTQGIFYIGGFQNSSIAMETHNIFHIPFIGCIKDVRLHFNGSLLNQSNYSSGLNIQSCDVT